jgi:hypothetical protein
MKNQLLKISVLAIAILGLNLQSVEAQILDASKYGFENNEPTDWAQVAGFSSSTGTIPGSSPAANAFVGGSKGMKIENAAYATAKLQTWRGGAASGSYSLDTGNYVATVWVYGVGLIPSTLQVGPSVSGKTTAVNFTLSSAIIGKWTKLYQTFTVAPSAALTDGSQWSTIKVTGGTAGTGSLYIDDVKFETYAGVQTYTLAEHLGFESADAEFEGQIEPDSNGDATKTGWFLQQTPFWTFSDVQKKTGQYSLKFDSSTALPADLNNSKQVQGGNDGYPVNSKVTLAAGSYRIQADVYIPSGKTVPTYLKLNMKTPFKASTITLDAGLTRDMWHTVQSDAISYDATTDSGYALQAEASDTNTVMYVDNLAWVDGTLATSNVDTLEGVKVFPNPASDAVTISAAKGSLITLANLTGAVVKTLKLESTSQTISIANLASGMYVVKVVSEGKSIVSKLIVN